MKIKKGQILEVDHSRKGIFNGCATEDFDTDRDEWYPLVVVGAAVDGMSTQGKWEDGESIPCRRNLVRSVRIVTE